MDKASNRTANLIAALVCAIIAVIGVAGISAYHHHFAKQGWCADLRDGQREMCMLSMDAGKTGQVARAEAEAN